MTSLNEPPGIVVLASPVSMAETIAHLEAAIQAHGLTLFAHIDHQGEAARVGLTMQPAQVLIFGSPRAGTPVMLAAPTSAIDLPLKILVWQDAAGATWVTNNSAAYLQARHAIPPELLQALAAVDALATAVGE